MQHIWLATAFAVASKSFLTGDEDGESLLQAGGYSVAHFSLVGFSSAAKACTVEIKPAAIRAARLFTCETECGDLADAQTRLKGACPVPDKPGARSRCARPVTCDIEMRPSVAWCHNSLNELQSCLAHNTCALRPGTHTLCRCLRDKDNGPAKMWFRSALNVLHPNYHSHNQAYLLKPTPWHTAHPGANTPRRRALHGRSPVPRTILRG